MFKIKKLSNDIYYAISRRIRVVSSYSNTMPSKYEKERAKAKKFSSGCDPASFLGAYAFGDTWE